MVQIMEVKNFYFKLVKSLRLVASPFDTQIKSMPDFVVIPDEIALTFYDSYLLTNRLKEENLISARSFDLLSELNTLFDEMSNNQMLWDLNSLRNNENWNRCRNMALQILDELDENYDTPNLDYHWIS
ncbi:hypothetical protein [Pedobacter nutrimenti]|uniref:hypothetical protein n=1 Tax=Pedobacter nutrimenti TaxID=1241337 RepID=UPI0029316AF4|nr:hypothetical protein [Pedobacter nutrimenti]